MNESGNIMPSIYLFGLFI